jgi:predicted phosphodiesterase
VYILISKDDLLEAYRLHDTFDRAAVALGINRKSFSRYWYENDLPNPSTIPKEDFNNTYKIACAGDTHLGSKQQQRTHFLNFAQSALDSGVKTLVMVGDICEGLMKRPSAVHDRFLHSIDDIYGYVVDTFDEFAGEYEKIHIISGNHDASIGHRNEGFDICTHLSNEFGNINYVTAPEEMIKPVVLDGGMRAILYHGFGNCTKNLVTRTRGKTIDFMNERQDWDMLFCGHCHRFSSDIWLRRHGYSLGGFQATTHFLATIGKTPDIRGDIIMYDVKKGVVKNVLDIPYIYDEAISHDYDF